MDFEYSDKVKRLIEQLSEFMDAHIYPSEAEMQRQIAEHG